MLTAEEKKWAQSVYDSMMQALEAFNLRAPIPRHGAVIPDEEARAYIESAPAFIEYCNEHFEVRVADRCIASYGSGAAEFVKPAHRDLWDTIIRTFRMVPNGPMMTNGYIRWITQTMGTAKKRVAAVADLLVDQPLEKLEYLEHDVVKHVNQEQWDRIAARYVAEGRTKQVRAWARQHAAKFEKNGVDPVVPEIGEV